jgi:hypothetical protein
MLQGMSRKLMLNEKTDEDLQTYVDCTEANEAFHGQLGFVKDGSAMVLHHVGVPGRRGEDIAQLS